MARERDAAGGAPTFSAIMPAYNTAQWITSAVESVLAQTRSDFELIVIDDGSTDDTREKVEPFLADSRVRLVAGAHAGPGASRNAAIERAVGRYISLIDSDDLWMPDYLETMAAALASDPAAGVAYTDAWILDDETRRIGRVSSMELRHPADTDLTTAENFLRSMITCGNFVFSATTIRRSVFEEVGRFRVDLPAGSDYELWLRIAAHGYRFVRSPRNLSIHRRRDGQITSSRVRLALAQREIYQLVADEYDIPDDIREAARSLANEWRSRIEVLDHGEPKTPRFPRPLDRLYATFLRERWFHRRPPAEITAAFPNLHGV